MSAELPDGAAGSRSHGRDRSLDEEAHVIDNSSGPSRPTPAVSAARRATSVRDLRRELAISRRRLAEAEADLAAVAERDHKLRNLVAGLSGAAYVLSAVEFDTSALDTSGEGRRLLVAAHAELSRLQELLGGRRADGPWLTAVGPVLRDLAAVHGASGTVVHVAVEGDPVAAVEGSTLAQVVANLLVNCARHAPGATVWMRARRTGDRVCIEVADDGPGLPTGAGEALLLRGVRGPRSAGSGLGLTITADLLCASGGSIALRSPGRGVTAVVELPVASRVAQRLVG
ncbi:MAG: HAMP domain-containing histidine kinase [Pseudonocardiales bacterium]|nr:HAMP domain-containing histidine kinase [Pseudonocardiales bacterium]